MRNTMVSSALILQRSPAGLQDFHQLAWGCGSSPLEQSGMASAEWAGTDENPPIHETVLSLSSYIILRSICRRVANVILDPPNFPGCFLDPTG